MGPFQIYDMVGMETPYHLARTNPDPEMQQFAEIIKRDYLDQGRLGVGVGKGFYDYS